MKPALIALTGSPNVGKTALFNALTGSQQKVANYPGVTVERKVGRIKTSSGKELEIVDLPGIYGFNPLALDEKVTVDVLSSKSSSQTPDAILAVADSTNLERSLRLILELKELGKPIIVALNMVDLAKKRGLKLDIGKLSQGLGVQVIPTVAVDGSPSKELINALDQLEIDETSKRVSKVASPKSLSDLAKTHAKVKKILKEATHKPLQDHYWTRKIDSLVLHPILSLPILFAVLFCVFQAVFSWSEAPMDLIEAAVSLLGHHVSDLLPSGALNDLIVNGMISGVGSVLVFLPQVLMLFFFIYLLEASGYMMRAAYILDRSMNKIGLPGLSLVPLLSSFACAIPGIMAARTIKNSRDRLRTIILAPLMTCSARLPVYILLIGAFIPSEKWGIFNLQGLVLFGLFGASIVFAVIVAFASKMLSQTKDRTPFLMELPTYKWPSLKNLMRHLWVRTKAFLSRAGKLILGISIAIWFLSSYPKPPEDWNEPAITYSVAGRVGKFIEPVVAPIGYDWRIATGLLSGFAAREVLVGVMGTVFAVEDAEEVGMSSLQEKMAANFSVATGLSLLAWYIFSPQCLATFAVMRRETNGWQWPLIGFSYMLGLAYLMALITYRIALLFSH